MRFLKSVERGISRIKQHFILKKLVKGVGLSEVVEKYRSISNNSEAIGGDSNIWVMWLQGEENMPELVKICYNSIRAHAGSHPVVLLDERNWKDYVSLPSNIIDKIEKGIIDRTHTSDIIRSYLLKEYGGIWVDATILMNGRCFAEFCREELRFWSCRGKTERNNVSRGYWTSYFQAAGKGCIVQSFIYDAHIHYWSRTDTLAAYLLLDYIFWIGFSSLPQFREVVMEVPVSLQGELMKKINTLYTESGFRKICGEGVNFSKLSYKRPVTLTTAEGGRTMYAFIKEKYLNK